MSRGMLKTHKKAIVDFTLKTAGRDTAHSVSMENDYLLCWKFPRRGAQYVQKLPIRLPRLQTLGVAG